MAGTNKKSKHLWVSKYFGIGVALLTVGMVAGCGAQASTNQSSGATTANSVATTTTAPAKVLRFGYITLKGSTPGDPIGWAAHTGLLKSYYSRLGITGIQFIPFDNGPDLASALQGGSVDVGELGDTPAVNAEANGFSTKLIDFTNVGNQVWLVTKKGGPKTIQDLKGQTVATAPGSYMSRYLLTLLNLYGLSSSVKVDPILPADAQAALQSGSIAAYAAPTDTGPQLIQDGFVTIDLASKHNLTGTGVTVASPSFINANPKFAKTWVDLTQASIQNIKQNASAYYQFAAQATGFSVNIVKESSPISDLPTVQFPAAGIQSLENVEKFLVSQGIAKKSFAITNWEVK